MSERTSRQRYFPARRKLGRPQIRPRYTRQLPESQSTLTQLNYVVPTTNGGIDQDLSDIDEAEFTGSTTRKRRKLATIRRSERQSTLTQWEWFEHRRSSDSEEIEKENRPEWMAQEVEISKTEQSPSLPPPASSPPKSSASQEIYNPPQPPSTDIPFITPQKPIKKEIPSSQSPAATPISNQRTPRSACSNQTLYTPPTNMSPLGSKCAGESPLRGKYTGVFRALADPEEPLEKDSKDYSKHHLAHTGTARTKAYEATRSTKVHDNCRSSQATTVDLYQSSPEERCKRTPLRGGRRGEQTLNSREVDFYGASTSSPPRARPPSPMPPESQLPMTISSDIEGVDYTPLQPLENSEDLPTVSQLLPESMR